MATMTGTVRKVIFADGDFRVYDTVPGGVMKVRGGDRLAPGTRFTASGRSAPYKGRTTFEAVRVEVAGAGAAIAATPGTAPVQLTPEGVAAWARRSGIAGVGDVAARSLEGIPEDGIHAVMNDAEALGRLCRIPVRKAAAIVAAWARDVHAEALAKLLAMDVPPHAAASMVARHGRDAVDLVARDPWRLMEGTRATFPQCERVAGRIGLASDCDARIAAGLAKALAAAALNGSTGLAETTAVQETAAALGLDGAAVAAGVARAIAGSGFATAGTVDFAKAKGVRLVQTRRDRAAEVAVVDFLTRRGAGGSAADVGARVTAAERQLGLKLDASQREAALKALSSPVSVITGGPGTGKTTLTRIVIAASRGFKRKVELVAPTGRAAKRLSDVTGLEARTIHRALEYNPKRRGFERCASNPLEADVVIVDETSMVDLQLASALFAAVKRDARVIIVGDVDQLPSVGAGNVLGDVIASGAVPVARLRTIHRQGEGSGIVACAHAVNAGRHPEDAGFDDFEIEYIEDQDRLRARVVELSGRVLPAAGYDREQIMVLAPAKRGPTGVERLNKDLKAAINPGTRADTAVFDDAAFSVGDRVMHVRNDYEKGVVNGDMGTVVAARPGHVRVSYPQGEASYGPSDILDIQHGLASTIHKAQGSEVDCVVLVLDRDQFNASRRLVYTAATRAKKRLIVLTQRGSLAKAIGRTQDGQRTTGMPSLLARALADGTGARAA